MVFVWTLDVTPEWPRSSAFYFPEHHAWEVRQSKLLCRICSDMLWLLVAMIHHDTSWYLMIHHDTTGGLERFFIFPYTGNIVIPLFFRGVQTTNQTVDLCSSMWFATWFSEPMDFRAKLSDGWTMKSDENRWRSAKNGPYHAHVSFESWNCVRIRRFRSVEHGTSMEWFIFTGFAV